MRRRRFNPSESDKFYRFIVLSFYRFIVLSFYRMCSEFAKRKATTHRNRIKPACSPSASTAGYLNLFYVVWLCGLRPCACTQVCKHPHISDGAPCGCTMCVGKAATTVQRSWSDFLRSALVHGLLYIKYLCHRVAALGSAGCRPLGSRCSPKASTNVLHNPGCPQGRAPESSPRHIVDPHALVSEGRRFIVQLRCTKLVVLLRSTTNCGFQNKHKGAKHSEARTTTQPTSLSKSDPSPHYIVF